jgi:hypothetical protein
MRWRATAEPADLLKKLVVNPLCPNRIKPRVRKRRPKEYNLMKQPCEVFRQLLAEQATTATM